MAATLIDEETLRHMRYHEREECGGRCAEARDMAQKRVRDAADINTLR